jgi:hypothetical protein
MPALLWTASIVPICEDAFYSVRDRGTIRNIARDKEG